MRRTTTLLAFLTLAAGALEAQASGADQPSAGIISGPQMGDRAPTSPSPGPPGRVPAGPSGGLSAQRGKVVVLAFYPQDFTSGCTAQMRTFTDQYADLFGDGVVVVGISPDSLATHVRFAQSLGLPFRLLSDPDQMVSRAWGSAGENGKNRRTIFVIDRQGKITYTDRRFGALDPKAYEHLKQAVAIAKR